MEIVDYVVARTLPLPPIRAAMYEYVTAGNGVFVRGRREGLEVMMPVATFPPDTRLRGLAEVEPYVRLDWPRVPAYLVDEMLRTAVLAMDQDLNPLEALFYLIWSGAGWRLVVPPQERAHSSVRPVGDNPSYADALIEVHSHHSMQAAFSPTDDVDETGYRIYGVLGRIYSRPVLRVRVGLYGHTWEIPAGWVFDLPYQMTDAQQEQAT